MLRTRKTSFVEFFIKSSQWSPRSLEWGGNCAPFSLKSCVKYVTILMAFVGDFYHPEPFGMSPTPRRKGVKARKLTNMKKSYEYRAYPTTKQRHTFLVWLALLHNVYNQALAWRIDAYQKNSDSVKWTTQANALPALKAASKALCRTSRGCSPRCDAPFG